MGSPKERGRTLIREARALEKTHSKTSACRRARELPALGEPRRSALEPYIEAHSCGAEIARIVPVEREGMPA